MTDALGNPLRIIITPGQSSDYLQAAKLLDGIKDAYVIADRGYDSQEVRDIIQSKNCTPVIPSRSNARSPANYDRYIYKERSSIEIFFGNLKQFRRIFSRFDKSMRNFRSQIHLAGACLWLR